jgi:alkanesulfonate monooxygenase SsuD/methylene tetrahydromethanopterin reductase-like flavin-dependent oxidoreductase (luciferase family)
VASIHKLSGGRMTLGIGLGGREDDYQVAGVEKGTRGNDLDAMLERVREIWAGDEVGPDLETEPHVLRLARRGDRELDRQLGGEGTGERPAVPFRLRGRRLPGALPLPELERPGAGRPLG